MSKIDFTKYFKYSLLFLYHDFKLHSLKYCGWAEKLPPFLLTSLTVAKGEKERSGPKVDGERVRRGGEGVEMCSQSSLKSYNFILLILRGWKLFLSPHLQPFLLLFFSIHFCLLRRGVAIVKVSTGAGKREERESNYI